MYCQTCDADVAAEVSADGKSLLCTTCGNEVRRTHSPSLSDDARSARDLLERWSNDEGADPFGPIGSGQSSDGHDGVGRDADRVEDARTQPPNPSQPPARPVDPDVVRRADAAASLSGPKIRRRRDAGSQPPDRHYEDSGDLMERPRPERRSRREAFESTDGENYEAGPRSDDRGRRAETFGGPGGRGQADGGKHQKTFRIDAAHLREATVEAGGVGSDGPAIPPRHRRPAPAMPDGHRLDGRHELAAPHMSTESFIPPHGKRPGRVESVTGQLLAYGGVGLLTVGTALILYGYFGGPVQYAPTGWLFATIGQMLLLLGVVTLISGGMQQTTHEVGARVADLGTRLGRIEETTELALASPHFLKDRSRSAATVAASQREDLDPPDRRSRE